MVFRLGAIKARVALILILMASLFYLQSSQKNPEFHQAPRLALRGELLVHTSFGFQQVLADLIWLRLIQDIDYHDGQKQNKGWVYQMLDGITSLDRRFQMAYIAGATVLSVLVQDVEGANLIFDRGVLNFPND